MVKRDLFSGRALGRELHFDVAAGNELGVDDRGRVVAGVFRAAERGSATIEARSTLSGSV